MPESWIALPLDKPLYANVDEDAIAGYLTAIENGFINDLEGHSRFPGLIERAQLADNGRVYLHDLNGDLIAATSKGRIYRIDRSYNVEAIEGVAVAGGRRVIFQKTDRDLLMAAGGPIVRLRNHRSEILSKDAPLATHVGWIDGFTLAAELNSGNFRHAQADEPDQWDPLDIFAASGHPDNINSLIVTPFREVLLGGEASVEQFERLPTGDVPFFRRWTIGDGVKFPYVQLFADNALWTINALTELVRFRGQGSEAVSDQIGRLLEAIDDWTDAWMGGFPDKPLHTIGHKFLIIQAPNATNPYGTKGVTLAFDYKNRRFSTLYGWDDSLGLPARWPGWSHWPLWDKVFVGGEGKIYELSPASYRLGSGLQRWLIRTAHISEGAALEIKNFRLRIKRGIGTSATAPSIRARCSRDGRPFGPWVQRSLGTAGQRVPYVYFGHFGSAQSFMWEISSADDCAIELSKAEVLADPIEI